MPFLGGIIMEFIIGLIILLVVISIIKEFISEHIKGFLIFLGVVAAIIALIICTINFGIINVIKVLLLLGAAAAVIAVMWRFIMYIKKNKEEFLVLFVMVAALGAIIFCSIKFGLWNVIKVMLLLALSAVVIMFAWAGLSVAIENYYDKKAIKTEAKVKAYVMGRPRTIGYDELRRNTCSLYSNVKLGKNYDVMDYINQSINEFVDRNVQEIFKLVTNDVNERGSVTYNIYCEEVFNTVGGYCIGNYSLNNLIQTCLTQNSKPPIKLGNMVIYKSKYNNGKADNKYFKQYEVEVEEDDDDNEYDDDDDYSYPGLQEVSTSSEVSDSGLISRKFKLLEELTEVTIVEDTFDDESEDADYITQKDKNGKNLYYKVIDGKKRIVSRSEYETHVYQYH